ncbi:MAG: endopolygalacturonase [Chitinivibrionales bacterium]|nr:endopolygalacturonase [Chitinivibrionales bacterium]
MLSWSFCACRRIGFFGSIIFLSSIVWGENIVFPPDAGVVDVTQAPFNAPNDGVGDATDEIQLAINTCANKSVIIYFPNGTYNISGTLKWGTDDVSIPNPLYDETNSTDPWARDETLEPKNEITLQGQSMDGTIIRLPSGTFTNPDDPKAMVLTGYEPAQRFRNCIRNMTFLVEGSNEGAIGVQFNASNTGMMEYVKIISEDRQAHIGLDMSFTGQIGPCLVKKCFVDGFKVGIQTAQTAINSITFEHITIQDQVEAGFLNLGQTVSLRKLTSTNNITAVENSGVGFMVILDSDLTGSGSTASSEPAILNKGDNSMIFARNIRTQGYSRAITNEAGNLNDVNGADVDEFTSHDPLSLFDQDPVRSLGLTIEEPPEMEWETDFSQWANVEDYGAHPDDGVDDATGIQAAIDAGMPIVYLPHGQGGTYNLDADSQIVIRGNVKRIIGCSTIFEKQFSMDITPAFRLGDDLVNDVVMVERIDIPTAIPKGYLLDFNSSKTLVMKSTGMNIKAQGNGKIFLEDHGALQCRFERGVKVWARQLDVENDELSSEFMGKILNSNAQLWILGLKTERDGVIIRNRFGAMTELLGGFSYTTHDPRHAPMFTNENSAVSIVFSEIGGRGTYDTLVGELRVCNTGWVRGEDAPVRYGGSHSIPLYAGYCVDANNNPGSCGPCPKIDVKQALVHADGNFPFVPSKMAAPLMTTITIPGGAEVLRIFDLQGRKQWETVVSGKANAKVMIPAEIAKGIAIIRFESGQTAGSKRK